MVGEKISVTQTAMRKVPFHIIPEASPYGTTMQAIAHIHSFSLSLCVTVESEYNILLLFKFMFLVICTFWSFAFYIPLSPHSSFICLFFVFATSPTTISPHLL